MKKALVLFLSLIFVFTSALFISCGEHEHQYSDWSYNETTHYKQCTVEGCEEKSAEGNHIFYQGACTYCACKEVFNQTATPDNAFSVFNSVKDGDEIILTPGTYALQVSLADKKNVTVTGQNGVIFEDNIKLMGGCENITIQNITFNKPIPQNYNTSLEAGGVRILGDVNGLTIKNCEFTNFSHVRVYNSSAFTEGIKDLVIDGCSFIELSDNNNTHTAVYMGCTLENVTVNDCVFDTVEYNALQLSGTVKGKVNLTNSTYKDIGARFFNINNAGGVTWDISGNKFYQASTSQTGQYFKGSNKTGTAFNIGVNYWSIIPSLDTEYFALYDAFNSTEDESIYVTDGITYNEEAQLQLD